MEKQYKMPLIICGGHFSPAVAVIEQLLKKNFYDIHYLGIKHALSFDKAVSLEYQVLKNLQVTFHPIITGRLYRYLSLFFFLSLFKIPIGFWQNFVLLRKIKPKIIISFGGYAALPTCLLGFFLKIPIIVHEQTERFGLTNRIIGRYASLICLSWPKTENIPNKKRTVITGNPIRESIFTPKKADITDFGNKKLKLIYITGGSLGARTINKIVTEVLNELTLKYRVLHQCGSAQQSRDFHVLEKIKLTLPVDQRENYKLVKFVPFNEVGAVYLDASLVISRSGANTTCELEAIAKPSVLIPLPWSAQGEQRENAKRLEQLGQSIIIDQQKLTKDKLVQAIECALTMKIPLKAAKERRNNFDTAAFKIVNIIEEMIKC